MTGSAEAGGRLYWVQGECVVRGSVREARTLHPARCTLCSPTPKQQQSLPRPPSTKLMLHFVVPLQSDFFIPQ